MCATSWNVKPIWINAIKSNGEVNEGRVERKKKNLMKLNHIENYCVRKMAHAHTNVQMLLRSNNGLYNEAIGLSSLTSDACDSWTSF